MMGTVIFELCYRIRSGESLSDLSVQMSPFRCNSVKDQEVALCVNVLKFEHLQNYKFTCTCASVEAALFV